MAAVDQALTEMCDVASPSTRSPKLFERRASSDCAKCAKQCGNYCYAARINLF